MEHIKTILKADYGFYMLSIKQNGLVYIPYFTQKMEQYIFHFYRHLGTYIRPLNHGFMEHISKPIISSPKP